MTKVVNHPAAGREDLAGPTTTKQRLERFAAWWGRQGPDIRAGIREIVNADGGRAPVNARCDEVLAHLNRLRADLGLGQFRYVDEHRRFIRSRLQSGITVQQLKAINALKARHAKDPENSFSMGHLRPKTLYAATNCENYLAELPPADEPEQGGMF